MIILSYKISDILDQSKITSLYRANMAVSSETPDALDSLGLHERDDERLKKYLKTGCALLADTFSGYTKNLINSAGDVVLMEGEPFEFDVTYDTVENCFVFRMNMPETFNLTILTSLNEAVIDALENYVLYRISRMKTTESETYFEDWEAARSLIRGYIGRRTEGVKRNYNFI